MKTRSTSKSSGVIRPTEPQGAWSSSKGVRAGKTWEDLLGSMLFEPLGMTTAGFGAPASPNKVDQPWAHTAGLLSGIEAVPSRPRADNPLAIGPAGEVHCCLGDLAKYAAFHVAGERGESKLGFADAVKRTPGSLAPP